MKVAGIVSVLWTSDSVSRNLILQVKFKLPKQWIHRRERTCIASTWDIGNRFDDREDMLKYCVELLSNKVYLEEAAKDLMIQHVKWNYTKAEENENEKRISELIHSINKTNFEVEIDYVEKISK